VQRIQRILDRSVELSGPVQRSFFGKPERRLAAVDFLTRWNSIYMCSIATSGTSSFPHLAAIRLEFDVDGRLPMLIYAESVRARDLRANPRVAVQKQVDDGTILTCYARAEFLDVELEIDARGRSSTRLMLHPTRLFGIGPYVSVPAGT
jgi:hypothetical protein